MYWSDSIAGQLKDKGPQLVDDMKTPSGRIHVGSLRGVILHDVIFRSFKEQNIEARSTYVFDDHDPMDSLPVYLERERFERYMGQPLYTAPSPETGFDNYARFYAQEFIEVFNRLGAYPEIIWASELYKSGEMNEVIKICLDNAEKIRKIYKEVANSIKGEDWYPYQVICENCKKVGTTKVYDWDGETVAYRCVPDLVTWAKGCGYEGGISPFNGNGKLPWKVEWGAKWKVLGVTIEGAGKDHMTVGGSHDIASAICERVLEYKVPFKFSYEFFLIGGKKMSSSKGLGSSAKEVSEILPPELLRFVLIRAPLRAIDFDPAGNTMPDLFDEYDRCAKAYFKSGPQSEFGRVFELAQVLRPPKEKLFLPRFRQIALYLQMPKMDLEAFFTEATGEKLKREERELLQERIKYAKLWLETYAPEEFIYRVTKDLSEQAKKLSSEQKKYLLKIAEILPQFESPKELEYQLYEVAKKQNIASQEAFAAIYKTLIGKDHGPKAAWLIMELNKQFVIERFQQVAAL